MKNFETTVPFDPGYSAISFSFIGNLDAMTEEYFKLKVPHQKKFWLIKFEPTMIDFINKSTAFYLGCILWGGFLSFRFKKEPKEIEGNNNLKLSEKERQEIDCTVEVQAIKEYVDRLNKDCKYFLNKPAKILPIINQILDSYVEFAELNHNFTATKSTNDIKTPKVIEHFDKLSEQELDLLYEKIQEAISEAKIENLLELGFYKA